MYPLTINTPDGLPGVVIHRSHSRRNMFLYAIRNNMPWLADRALYFLLSPREARLILFAKEKKFRAFKDAFREFEEHIPFVRHDDVTELYLELSRKLDAKHKRALHEALTTLSTRGDSKTLQKTSIVVPFSYYLSNKQLP